MYHTKKVKMFKLLFVLAAFSSFSYAFDYCTISTQNTLCRFQPGVYGSACVQVNPIIITATDKVTILALHNDLRRKVAKGLVTAGAPGPQPSAANMRELAWDDELALMAQTWANQCTFAHDTNRDVQRFAVGQNLYTSFNSVKPSGTNWAAAINASSASWFGEVSNMNATYVNTFPQNPTTGVIGHYTQLVWGETNLIGCGVIGFYNSAQPKYPYQTLYACNYGKSGNWIGSPVYKVGTPASACPAGTVAKDGLCA